MTDNAAAGRVKRGRSGPVASHWGPGIAEVEDGRIVSVEPHPSDPDPSPINGNIARALSGGTRVLRPAIRAGWLENGPGSATRGEEPFVEVSWERAYDLLVGELGRIRSQFGNEAIFAGSYGWSSAGRVHHAQTLLKRFLNTQGGFVRSKGNYSYQAAIVLMPHIVGRYADHVAQATRWPVIAKESDLVVMFGGIAPRNSQVSDGGLSKHRMGDAFRACAENGVRFVNVSPVRDDAATVINAEWLAPRAGTDTAVMMGLAHTLLEEDLHDRAFLDRYTTGFDRVAAYLRGDVDGTTKDAAWAAEIAGLPAERLNALAREMASGRTMLTCAAGLQRADYGEQPLWMVVTLAAMLGQIGLPGGGYTIGYGVNGNIGHVARPFRWGVMEQGENPVGEAIPVAMVADMLLDPGGTYAFNGETRVFPDIKMVWWAGGNPFHHHQDLNRLRRAFARPETVIVNEIGWTATARHADIVLPVAAPPEREDFAGGKSDNGLLPMPKLVDPPGEARLEYDIYADLAHRLGDGAAFTEGLDAEGWSMRIWAETQRAAEAAGHALPDWESFITGDLVRLPDPSPDQVFLAEFRADPGAHPLPTPSGKIELFSERIATFGLEDCPGQATWFPPRDRAAGMGSLDLLSGQPGTRLHSQLDDGAFSLSAKIQGREPVLIHPDDARARGIEDGDVVELSNARGRCLAGARVTEGIRPGTVFLWTGAWYDPDFDAPQHCDRHGNPNVLTQDGRTSHLAQGPASHSARVDLARFEGDVPEIEAHRPPRFKT
ncbi:MAG: molybdopterin-dependent oxidoreductase [Pseudomonadota bacterium]